MIALSLSAGAVLVLLVSLVRAFTGPTLHDRALAVRSGLLNAAVLAGAVAVAANRPEFIDIGYVFALGALVIALAVAKLFRVRTFQAPLASAMEER